MIFNLCVYIFIYNNSNNNYMITITNRRLTFQQTVYRILQIIFPLLVCANKEGLPF
jgi:hypothetical protein